jgi:hypothetical protein
MFFRRRVGWPGSQKNSFENCVPVLSSGQLLTSSYTYLGVKVSTQVRSFMPGYENDLFTFLGAGYEG